MILFIRGIKFSLNEFDIIEIFVNNDRIKIIET